MILVSLPDVMVQAWLGSSVAMPMDPLPYI